MKMRSRRRRRRDNVKTGDKKTEDYEKGWEGERGAGEDEG